MFRNYIKPFLKKSISRSKDDNAAIILLYHRIVNINSDPWELAVSPEKFSDHLEILKKFGNIISLQQMIKKSREGNLQNSIVITFDDGYVDNLLNAKPILERYDSPATMFVCSGLIGCNREFWWDDLERILLQPGDLPENLSIEIENNIYQWELSDSANYSHEDLNRYKNWLAWEEDIPTNRHSIYQALYKLLRPLPHEKVERLIDKLLAWAGLTSEPRPSYRPVSFDELITLEQNGLIVIGGHTSTHPILSRLNKDLQYAEIHQGKSELEDILNHPVNSFSYPYGSKNDYSNKTVRIVSEVGFNCACSNFHGYIGKGNDLFQLPRFQVQNWNGEEFQKQIWNWFNN